MKQVLDWPAPLARVSDGKRTWPEREGSLGKLFADSIRPVKSQDLLFDQGERRKHKQLDTLVDQIKDRFGGRCFATCKRHSARWLK